MSKANEPKTPAERVRKIIEENPGLRRPGVLARMTHERFGARPDSKTVNKVLDEVYGLDLDDGPDPEPASRAETVVALSTMRVVLGVVKKLGSTQDVYDLLGLIEDVGGPDAFREIVLLVDEIGDLS